MYMHKGVTGTMHPRAMPRRKGMSGWLDDLASGAGSVLHIFGAQQQAQGQAQQANLDLQAALAAQQGSSTSTILLLGVAGLAAFLILRKKKES